MNKFRKLLGESLRAVNILSARMYPVFAVSFISFLYAQNALAQQGDPAGSAAGGVQGDPAGGAAGGVQGDPAGGAAGGVSGQILTNPLRFNDITSFLTAIIDVLIILATPIVVLAIIYAGFLFVTAQGNESQLSKARAALTWAIVGGVIVLGATVIMEVLEGTIRSFTG